MKDKKVKIFLIIFAACALVTAGIVYYSMSKVYIPTKIDDNYIAIFHGGSSEVTYETYIYKVDNGKDNMGFRYIYAQRTTTSWGSKESTTRVLAKGNLTWTDDVFEIAKKNNTYSFVTLPNDNKAYTIDDFAAMFLKN